MTRQTIIPIIKNNYILFTGGPGSGKTTVLNELSKQGHLIVREVARDIIKTQLSIGSDATHFGNRVAYLDLMLKQSIADFNNMLPVSQPVFFDRGIPDLDSYAQQYCNSYTKKVAQAAQHYRYNPIAFVFPPWPEIYCHDTERKLDFQETVKIYHSDKKALTDCGYLQIEIPKLSIIDRVDFILTHLPKIK